MIYFFSSKFSFIYYFKFCFLLYFKFYFIFYFKFCFLFYPKFFVIKDMFFILSFLWNFQRAFFLLHV